MIYHEWKNEHGRGAVVDRLSDLPFNWESDVPSAWVATSQTNQIVRDELIKLAQENRVLAERLRALEEANRALKQRNDSQAETLTSFLKNMEANRTRVATLEEENWRLLDQTRLDNLCDVCCGSGKPVSGQPCACGGTGSMRETVAHLRMLALIDLPDRIAALEAELAANRAAAAEVEEEENRRLRIKHDSIRASAQAADDSSLRRDVLFILDVPLDRGPAHGDQVEV